MKSQRRHFSGRGASAVPGAVLGIALGSFGFASASGVVDVVRCGAGVAISATDASTATIVAAIGKAERFEVKTLAAEDSHHLTTLVECQPVSAVLDRLLRNENYIATYRRQGESEILANVTILSPPAAPPFDSTPGWSHAASAAALPAPRIAEVASPMSAEPPSDVDAVAIAALDMSELVTSADVDPLNALDRDAIATGRAFLAHVRASPHGVEMLQGLATHASDDASRALLRMLATGEIPASP